MQQILDAIANDIWVLIPLGGISIGLAAVIGSFVAARSRVKERERSRREIAAYIAEGSMTPEEGERLMAAGRRNRAC